MLSQRTALRLAEATAKWLGDRDPRQWLNQAIVVTTDAGKHFVCPRAQALEVLLIGKLDFDAAATTCVDLDMHLGLE